MILINAAFINTGQYQYNPVSGQTIAGGSKWSNENNYVSYVWTKAMTVYRNHKHIIYDVVTCV